MRYPAYHSILTNFDTSIILPFYKKLGDFKRILPINAHYFQRNGIEVIIVMDEPSEQEAVIDFIKKYPLINWIVIVNDQPHDWRNPCKAMNVGVKVATKNYIMVCSPESEFYTDVIFRLRYLADSFEPCFAIGKVIFGKYNIDNNPESGRTLPYGSLLVKKKHAEQVAGYSEYFDQWGGEDDNFRAKLEYHGIKKVYVDDAVLIHYEEEKDGFNQRAEKSNELLEEIVRRSYYPAKDDFINSGWGTDFSKIIYDYRDYPFTEELCKSHLNAFKRYEICRKDVFNKKYRIIALIQTYNEKQHMPEVLLHLDTVCDGIILLDDDSTDGTYELAKSEKLLLKVQKSRKEFDDLKNRNLLLDIASFIKSEWAFFIDADERFDSRFQDLEKVIDHTKSNVVSFWLVNTWDSSGMYRTDITDSGNYSANGILSRARMFKNDRGRVQIVIKDTRKLHFPVVPCTSHPYPSGILLIHYGLQDKEKRREKCRFYKIEDDYQKRELDEFYNYMLDDNPCLSQIDSISL